MGRGGEDRVVLFGVAGWIIGGQMAGQTIELVRLIKFDLMTAQTLSTYLVEAGRRLICLIAATCQGADNQEKEADLDINRHEKTGVAEPSFFRTDRLL